MNVMSRTALALALVGGIGAALVVQAAVGPASAPVTVAERGPIPQDRHTPPPAFLPPANPVLSRTYFTTRAEAVIATYACEPLHAPNLDGGQEGFVNFATAKLEAANIAAMRGQKRFRCTNGKEPLTSELKSEVNRALRGLKVVGKPGTDTDGFLPLVRLCSRDGEWDVVLRGLAVMMYRFPEMLDEDVKRHLLTDKDPLLSVRGRAEGDMTTWPCKTLHISETENHILLTRVSHYLTNQLLADKYPGDEQYNNQHNGMRDWILKYLQGILRNDFLEYNARPYQDYSMAALQTLYDYAKDLDVRLAAQLVLDYTSAKFAVSSSELRRNVPFRRLRDDDTDQLTDPQTWRHLVLVGPSFSVPWQVPQADTMVPAALTGYRLPDLITDLILHPTDFYQRFRHAGGEVYAGSPEYLISGGGNATPALYGVSALNFTRSVDAGKAVPTLLIPTPHNAAPILDRSKLIRILGVPDDDDRSNLCVQPNFACGVNLVVPDDLRVCGRQQFGSFLFLDASVPCGGNGRGGYYVAVRREPCAPADAGTCRSKHITNVGSFEVVPADRSTFGGFVQQVRDGNTGRPVRLRGNTYVTTDRRQLSYSPLAEPGDLPANALATGDVLTSDGHTGLVTVRNPRSGQVLTLDFHDAGKPRRAERAGQLFTVAPGTPLTTMAQGDNGQLDLFAIDRAGTPMMTWLDGRSWRPWVPVVGGSRFTAQPGGHLTTLADTLFAVGRDGVPSISHRRGDIWQPWTPVVPGSRFTAAPTARITALPDGLFVVDRDGVPSMSRLRAGVWQPWTPVVPGSRFTVAPTTPLAAIRQGDAGQIDLYAVDRAGTPMMTWTQAGTWQPWVPVVGRSTFATSAGGALTAVDQTTTQLDVFTVGRDGVPAMTWLRGSTWQPWVPVVAGSRFTAPPGAPITTTRVAGQLTAFVTSRDGVPYRTTLRGTTWQPWEPVVAGPRFITTPSATLAAIAQGDRQSDLFAVNTAGVPSMTWNNANTWQPWVPVNAMPIH